MEKNLLPDGFIHKMHGILGDELQEFVDAHSRPVPVSIRLNPFKQIHTFENCERIAWASSAFYLPERISFTLDPLFQAGCYYVQEASSMYLEQALKIAFAEKGPLRILDLCAAPGGKSTHIASIMPEGSLLVSNEVIASRNVVLQQNITKWGVSNVVVTQNEAADFGTLTGFFDVIIVDAPCSGEGLFRKDADAINHWSEENVEMCSLRQKTILNEIYPALKQNGYLIYSTCTFEIKENEDPILQLTDQNRMNVIEFNLPPEGTVKLKTGIQFYPHRVKGEGFFISLLRKIETSDEVSLPKVKSTNTTVFSFKNYLEDSDQFVSFIKNNEIYALPKNLANEINFLIGSFFVRKAGIHVGTLKGKDVIPSHELALSVHLSKQIPKYELSEPEALRYLRCESIEAKNVADGWTIVTFQNFPLGWIKVIGKRINNYFPRSQRILKS